MTQDAQVASRGKAHRGLSSDVCYDGIASLFTFWDYLACQMG